MDSTLLIFNILGYVLVILGVGDDTKEYCLYARGVPEDTLYFSREKLNFFTAKY